MNLGTLLAIIKKQKLLFAVISLVATISTTTTTAFLSFNTTFKKDCLNYINEYQLPDVYLLSKDRIKKEDISQIYTIDGVEDVYLRYNMNVNLSFDNHAIMANVRTYNDNSFPKFYYHQQCKKDKRFYPNILISKSLADNNKLILRGQFNVKIKEFDIDQKFFTNGIVDTPETIRTEISRGQLIDEHDFGYTFIHEEEIIKNLPQFANQGNEVIIRTKEGFDKSIIMEKAKNILTKNYDYQLIDTYTKEQTSSYKFIHENIFLYLDIVAFLIPSIFILITLILIFLFMYQIIKNMIREIGIMSALGVSNTGIFVLMCGFTLSISTIASILGNILAIPLAMFSHNIIGYNYNIPIGNGMLNGLVIFISILAITIIAILSSLITIFTIRKVTPISAINNQLDRKLKYTKFFERCAPKLSNKFLMVISSLKANKIRTFISIITIASVFILTFASLSIITSARFNVSQIENRLNFDAKVYEFDQYLGFDFFASVSSLNSVKKMEKSYILDTVIEFNNIKKDITLTALENNHSFLKLPNKDGIDSEIIDDSIVLESVLANQLGVKINDYIKIDDKSIRVNDISYLTLNKIQCISINTLLKLKGHKYKVANVEVYDKEAFIEEVSNFSNCVPIFSSNIVAQYNRDNSIVIIIFNIITVIAFIIGITVILAMQLLIFNQEKRKYCIMQMVGFSNKSILSFSIIQLLVYLIIGVVLAIAPAIILSKNFIGFLNFEHVTFFYFNYYWFYLVSIGMIVLLLAIINSFIAINLKNTRPAEFINSRE